MEKRIIHKGMELNEMVYCSCMVLTSLTGNIYWFRTCDYFLDLWSNGASVIYFPKNYKMKFTGHEEMTTFKYEVIGVTYNNIDNWLLDGMNLEGLVGGCLYFEKGTSVDSAKEGYIGVVGMELLANILATCKNVKEVIDKVSKIQVLSITSGETLVEATMHYMFVDSTGDTVILEAYNSDNPGIFKIYDRNENIGVMTNAPIYDKQLENLSWYISKSPELRYGFKGKPIKSVVINGKEIKANSNASHLNLNGTFPGSYSSYDRFIRLSMLKALNNDGNGFLDEKMLAKGSGILNSVFKPNTEGIFSYSKFDKKKRPVGNTYSETKYMIMYSLNKREVYIKASDAVAWTRYLIFSDDNNEIKRYKVNNNSQSGILKGN